jgi:hypothetical protein
MLLEQLDVELWMRVHMVVPWQFKILRAGGIAQVVECLSSKYSTSSSNPVLPKENQKDLPGVAQSAYNISYMIGWSRRTTIQGQPWPKAQNTIWKIN